MLARQATSLEGGSSGIAQDLRKRRRTELDYIGGYVAAHAAAARLGATRSWSEASSATIEPCLDNLRALLVAGAANGMNHRPRCAARNSRLPFGIPLPSIEPTRAREGQRGCVNASDGRRTLFSRFW